MYFNLYSKQLIWFVCNTYIEKVTNKKAITLVYYLVQQKSIIPRVILLMG